MTQPNCLFCGNPADHKCGDAHDCGGCCGVRGLLAAESPHAYKWVEQVVAAHIHTLEEENGRLREVLEKCGLHAPDCHAKLDQDEWVGCDCGLDDALAPPAPATGEMEP